jgi:hypothetical protein
MQMNRQNAKNKFKRMLCKLAETLSDHVATRDRQWTVKGFIDIFRNVYTISADTKVVSKILEIHLFPVLLKFAQKFSYRIVLADHQNYYPDISFVSARDESLKFALDIKTTYRLPEKPGFCNGFTLGSHGNYFIDRDKKKNIQFPYSQYSGHFCLGIIYTRTDSGDIDETRIYKDNQLQSIVSVIRDIKFFACEKWEIASDSQGSGNTANIGSIVYIKDILSGNGVFKNLGEEWFDEYWMNYGKITIKLKNGKQKKLTKLSEFLEFKGKNPSLVNPCIRTNRNNDGN